MKKHLFGAALLCLVAASGMALAQTIDDIQYYDPETGDPASPYAGQSVTVSGAIYVLKGTYNSGTHYLQGATGGIQFFDSQAQTLTYGDQVEVTGTVSAFGGEIQLAGPNVTYLGPGPEPTPTSYLPEEVLFDYETVGSFVSVIGTVTAVSSSSFELAAGDSSLVVYRDSDTGINLGDVDLGDTYMVWSPAVNYNGLIELKPRRQGDLVENPTGDTVPVIDNINCANWVPMAMDNIVVTADITDDNAVASASLYYRGNDGETPGSWNMAAMTNVGGSSYSGTIPGGLGYPQVDFYVEAMDDAAQVVTNPGDAPEGFVTVAVGLTSIYDVQYPVHPDSANQASQLNGEIVNVRGVVIAGTNQTVAPSQFYVQEPEKNSETNSYAYGGVLIYEGSALYPYYQGDLVEVGGEVSEYNNMTEILPHNGNAVNLVDFGQDLPAPSRVSTRVLADDSMPEVDGNPRLGEPWEAVWVETFNATVLDTLGYGEYIVSDTGARVDSLVVDPLLELTYEPMMGDVLKITSYIRYVGGDYVIVPTSDESIIVTGFSAAEDAPQILPAGGFRSVHPNPFNPSTNIKFAVNRDNLVQLNVYNIRGEKVRTLVQDQLPANEYTFVWDGKNDAGKNVASGQYFARLRIGKEVVQVRKMSLVK